MDNLSKLDIEKTCHIPVLLDESIELLKIKESGIYVDCTFGSGGHSLEIISRLNEKGNLVSFDCDENSINFLSAFSKFRNFSFIRDNFSSIDFHLKKKSIKKVDGFIFDLGLSSEQIQSNRGFSYRKEDDFLDMRMNSNNFNNFTAYDVVNNFSEKDLADIFYDFGEEFSSRKIARSICENRKKKKIFSVGDLVSIIISSLKLKSKRKKHPAKKVFQALRIFVNNEFENLKRTLTSSIEMLNKGGSIVVISYHSLEDRIVKQTFKSFCLEDRNFFSPKKPFYPKNIEVEKNNRSRSAKLRVFYKN